MKIKNPFIEYHKLYSEQHLLLDQNSDLLGITAYNSDDFLINKEYRRVNSSYFMDYVNVLLSESE